MSKQKTKEQERRFVEVLKNVFPDFPTGKLLESESPDFLLLTTEGKIGIEVTCIHQNAQADRPSLKQQEVERLALVLEALRLYEAKRLPCLHVSVHFGGETSFGGKNRAKLASALANLVAANIPQDNNSVALENDWEHRSAFPYDVAGINILCGFGMMQNHWTCPEAGFVCKHFIKELQQIITDKESKLCNYCPDCVAHWLLIVAQNDSPSTAFDPSEVTLNFHYNSSFSRVFLLNSLMRRIFELRVRAQAGQGRDRVAVRGGG